MFFFTSFLKASISSGLVQQFVYANTETKIAKLLVDINHNVSDKNIVLITTKHSVMWNSLGYLVNSVRAHKSEIDVFKREYQEVFGPKLKWLDKEMNFFLDEFTQWSETDLDDFANKFGNHSDFIDEFSYEKCVDALGGQFNSTCERVDKTYFAFKKNKKFVKKLFYAQENNMINSD